MNAFERLADLRDDVGLRAKARGTLGRSADDAPQALGHVPLVIGARMLGSTPTGGRR